MAAGSQQYPAGALYVVATPIGNLADLTLRAIHVLALADTVACEDTRMTQRLLQHLGLDKRLMAVHEHNENEAAQAVADALRAGQRVAYVSDAGTPGVSDPGARLVRAIRAAGPRVVPIPGASAPVTLVSAAGDVEAQGFTFAGFLPSKGGARREALAGLRRLPGAVVLFESPHRVEDLARELAAIDPFRLVTVAIRRHRHRARGRSGAVAGSAQPAAGRIRAGLACARERCAGLVRRVAPGCSGGARDPVRAPADQGGRTPVGRSHRPIA